MSKPSEKKKEKPKEPREKGAPRAGEPSAGKEVPLEDSSPGKEKGRAGKPEGKTEKKPEKEKKLRKSKKSGKGEPRKKSKKAEKLKSGEKAGRSTGDASPEARREPPPERPEEKEAARETRGGDGRGTSAREEAPPSQHTPGEPPGEPDGFADGFSPRTLEILAAARSLKDRLGHGAVTTGHLIAAILEEEAGIARDVFWDINAYPDMFVEEMARVKEIPVPETGLWFDEKVALVLERARDGAEALGGGPVEPEHLALALLSLADGPASEILEEFSMDREDLKAEILAHMGVPVEECPDWEHESKREKSRRIRKQKTKK